MPTVSYIKIFGPPVLKAINELKKIAVDMPEVCIMDSVLAGVQDYTTEVYSEPSFVMNYVGQEIELKRCSNIISKSGQELGEYDFFFEWFTEPKMEQINRLIEKIDETLKPLGCKYTITTKG